MTLFYAPGFSRIFCTHISWDRIADFFLLQLFRSESSTWNFLTFEKYKHQENSYLYFTLNSTDSNCLWKNLNLYHLYLLLRDWDLFFYPSPVLFSVDFLTPPPTHPPPFMLWMFFRWLFKSQKNQKNLVKIILLSFVYLYVAIQ